MLQLGIIRGVGEASGTGLFGRKRQVAGLTKLDQTGKLTYVHPCTGGHWLFLDRNGGFSHTQPKHFEPVTQEGVRPAIIFADGGAPIAACRDGNLYYASNWAGGDEHAPGGRGRLQ